MNHDLDVFSTQPHSRPVFGRLGSVATRLWRQMAIGRTSFAHQSNGNIMEIKNYTPHTITLTEGLDAGEYPSLGIARVDGLPLGPVVGLPDPAPDIMYVVSVLVAERLPKRTDLLVPGAQVRDKAGRIVGCRSLIRPFKASPALALLDAVHVDASGWWNDLLRLRQAVADVAGVASYTTAGAMQYLEALRHARLQRDCG